MTPTSGSKPAQVTLQPMEIAVLQEALAELPQVKYLGADKARMVAALAYRLKHLDGARA